MRVEPVEPLAFAEEAGRILQEAWPPPALLYTPEYLRWQFGFPGAVSALAVAAFDGDQPVAFIGATPRRLRRGGYSSEAFLLSFLAVRPAWQGKGVAALLYDALLEAICRAGVPVVSFAQVGSAGERCLRKAYPAAGFSLSAIDVLPTYSCLERLSASPPAVEAVEVVVTALQEVLEACADGTALHLAPDRMQLQRYGCDPRPRAAVLLRAADGRLLGGGMVVLAQVKNGRGVEELPIVENLFLREPRAEALAALCRFAGRRWPAEGRPRIVNLLNARDIVPAALSAAGLRKTSAGFTAYVAARDPEHPFLAADGTSLEVV